MGGGSSLSGCLNFRLLSLRYWAGFAQYAETFMSIEIWDFDLWRDLAEEQGVQFSGLGVVAQIISAVAGLITLLPYRLSHRTGSHFPARLEFHARETSRGFRRRRGLFTRTDVVMPLHRVQAVKIGTGILRNRFGWRSLSFVSLAQDSGSANHMVAPFAQDEEISPIIETAGFVPPAENLDWRRQSKRYRTDRIILGSVPFLLAVIPVAVFAPAIILLVPLALAAGAALSNLYAWKFNRNTLDAEQVISRRGLFAPKTQIASRVKLQSVELRQGPIAQRRGYATLHLGLAGGSFSFPASNWPGRGSCDKASCRASPRVIFPSLLDLASGRAKAGAMTQTMPFVSDNAASVHPRIWQALQDRDNPDMPYDGDRLSSGLDEAFSEVFGRECAALWVATGTAANCLALGTLTQPHGGVVCHREAHVELDEGGAPDSSFMVPS